MSGFVKVSKKWRDKAEVYRWFAREYPNADFSEAAAEAMYQYESTGIGRVNHYDLVDGKVNGYALGKHLQDLQLAMWIEDLGRPFMLTKYELLNDPDLKPIKQFLVDKFGDIEVDDLNALANREVLNKHIGKYMY